MDEQTARLSVRDIGVIVPSNIGDAVLTLPLIAEALAHFPKARLTIAGGPRARAVFEGDPRVGRFLEYGGDGQSWRERFAVMQQLRQQRCDVFVDVRHTVLPWCVRARWRTNPLRQPPRELLHRHERYRWYLTTLLRRLGITASVSLTPTQVWAFTPEEQRAVEQWWEAWELDPLQPILAISPGARSDQKRWPAAPFAHVCRRMMEASQAQLILTGEASERTLIDEICQHLEPQPVRVDGCTTMRTLALLLTRCDGLLTNDSATLHVASSVQLPTVALFGPTDPAKYGPRSPRSTVIHRDPITQISVEEVVHALDPLCHAKAAHVTS